jgi:hypothetical protein
LPPPVVGGAERGVAVGVRCLLPLCVPKLEERHAWLPACLVDVGPIRLGPVGGWGQRRTAVQPLLERRLVEVRRQGPREAGGGSPLQAH